MKKEILNKIISKFHADFFYPKIGLELEFYLTKNNQQIEADPDNVITSYLYGTTIVAFPDNIEDEKFEKCFS